MSKTIATIHRNLQVAFFILIASVSNAFGQEDDCSHLAEIGLNTTTRGFHASSHQPHCFEAYVPVGIMFLDAAVSGQAVADVKLRFHGRALDGITDDRSGFAYLDRSTASMLIEIRVPGRYLFCVTVQGPAEHNELKLRTGFTSREILPTKDGDPDEDEPPPDPFSSDSACGRLYGAGLTKDGDPDEDEPPPDPKALWRITAIREAVCQTGEIDDHGDTRFCATPLIPGESMNGEIRNRWADDDDFFILLVTRLRTVYVKTTGQTDTFGGLYDDRGYRIVADDDGGSDDNFLIVKTLNPGVYYVRVEGRDGQEGTYQLNVESRR